MKSPMMERAYKLAPRFASKALPILRVAFFFIAYGLILSTVDFSKLDFSKAGIAIGFSLAVAAILLQVALCTYRWQLLASAQTDKVPGFWFSFGAYIEGLFYNQVFPSPVLGDAVRIFRWRNWGVPLGAASISVFLDRLSGITGAALLVLLGLATLGLPSELGWASAVTSHPGALHSRRHGGGLHRAGLSVARRGRRFRLPLQGPA